MLTMYVVQKEGLYATDVLSLSQLTDSSRARGWIWVDIVDPDEKEGKIISELLGNEPELVDHIKHGTYAPPRVYTEYEMLHDYVLLSIPSVELEEQLQTYPIFVIIKKKMFITWGEEKAHEHSKIIESTIRRLREHVADGEELNSSFAIGVLFHEVAIKNSEVMLSIRDLIDQLEEQPLNKAGKKPVLHTVLSLKKMVSSLFRLLTNDRNFMVDVTDAMIPHIRLDKQAKSIVDDAIATINREIDCMDSYDRALDSFLTLQNLTSIRRVESSINYLTIILVISTIILIVLEILRKLELF